MKNKNPSYKAKVSSNFLKTLLACCAICLVCNSHHRRHSKKQISRKKTSRCRRLLFTFGLFFSLGLLYFLLKIMFHFHNASATMAICTLYIGTIVKWVYTSMRLRFTQLISKYSALSSSWGGCARCIIFVIMVVWGGLRREGGNIFTFSIESLA